MPTDNFYDEQTNQSEIKTEFVRKYFWAWAKVISKQVIKRGENRIGYIDLFAGQGRYEDGSKSTPILILEGAIRDPEIREMLVAKFNDEDAEKCQRLKSEIEQIEGLELLRVKPQVSNELVDDRLALQFEGKSTIPTLFFIDPWGYKGLSLRLVKAVIQSWGCDCMFFFNYNRINAALSNEVMRNNMNTFFGESRAENLRTIIEGRSPQEREALIVSNLNDALKECGGKFSIEYFFKDSAGSKTSHFLMFVSKNVLGYNIMKNIMARESSHKNEGVASFGFNPKDQERQEEAATAPRLFEMFSSPIDDLAEDLLRSFRGGSFKVAAIYQTHQVGKEFILKNYQDALRKLEEEGKVVVEPPAAQRRKINGIVTFGENVEVHFPDVI